MAPKQRVEQPRSRRPASRRQQGLEPATQNATSANHNESTAAAIRTFMTSLNAHYAALHDSVTPHLFDQLSKDYNTGKSDEQALYVATYRLFLSTKSLHLMQGFRAFLPPGWRDIDLGRLDHAIEAQVEKEGREARDSVGEPAHMIESEVAAKKKRRPANGFRASDPPDANAFVRPLPPKRKRTSNSDDQLPAPERKTYHRHQPTIRSASEVPHNSPIYPSKRAILARQTNKPYIHSLCGARFTYPADVQRHHNGQNGKEGCWAKKGKPEGNNSEWNAHESCRVGLTSLEYVKVKEGFVVTDWRQIGEDIREER